MKSRYEQLGRFLYVLALLIGLESFIVYGFRTSEPHFLNIPMQAGSLLLILGYIVWVFSRLALSGWRFRARLIDIGLVILIIGQIVPLRAGGAVVAFRLLVSFLITVFRSSGLNLFFAGIRLNPARLLLLSFLAAIMAGTMLFMLPAATVDRHGASFIDAFFTATSATCVTGLIVQDTGTYFSLFGQLVILALIQMGGLGIMTFSTLFALLLGRDIGLREAEHMRGILDQHSTGDMYRLVIQIIKITFMFELTGAALLFAKFVREGDSHRAIFSSVFHSISAFCNAGFSLNADSLARYVGDTYTNSIFMLLIVFGGLGFVVMNELGRNMRGFNPFTISWKRLSVPTKLVLVVTGGLLIVGTLIVFFFEFDNTMLNLSTGDKLLAALFQSVTFRTAGFNTIDIAHLRDVTLFVGVILMFIGASPASTGGGIKTTTLAILILSVRSLLFSRDKVEVWNRTITPQAVYKSIAILLFSFTLLLVFTILLVETQEGEFLDILFEASSALGTVGLSTGVTTTLTVTGKFLISILMYVGRVGPLTVALALGEVRKLNIEYPITHISVG